MQLTFDPQILNLFVAAALGMFLGLEREWSNKSAGIRTFTLTSLVGAAATTVGEPVLVAIGGVLVLVQGVLLGVRGLVATASESRADAGLSLTTSTSLLMAYAVGILVASGHLLLSVVISITSSSLLVLRRELHGFANQLSREEVRSAAEFAIIAFVVYPLLPSGTYGPWNAIDPPLVWTLVIAVSGIGFVNYALMQRYGGQGVMLTGFLGGLVNSTAVIGEIAGRAESNPGISGVAVGTILLADAAMAVRNAVIVIAFVPSATLSVALPLGCIAVGGLGLSLYDRSWDREFDVDFESPFRSSTALKFGLLFLAVLVTSAAAQAWLGAPGFLLTSFLSGMVSSGTTTTTAVTLASTGQIPATVAAQGVFLGTVSSVFVKIALAASINRSLFAPVARRSVYLAGIGFTGVAATTYLL